MIQSNKKALIAECLDEVIEERKPSPRILIIDFY